MDKNNSMMIPEEVIMSKIYLIRGMKVMLDRDLAELYEVETKALKQAVRRNMDIFPENFMFELAEDEFNHLRSQIVTSSWGGTRYLSMAFSEHGVAMLSSVLRSRSAIQVNIQIILVFSKIRKMLLDSLSIKLDIEEIKRRLNSQDKNLELVFSYLDELIEKKVNPTEFGRIPCKLKPFLSLLN